MVNRQGLPDFWHPFEFAFERVFSSLTAAETAFIRFSVRDSELWGIGFCLLFECSSHRWLYDLDSLFILQLCVGVSELWTSASLKLNSTSLSAVLCASSCGLESSRCSSKTLSLTLSNDSSLVSLIQYFLFITDWSVEDWIFVSALARLLCGVLWLPPLCCEARLAARTALAAAAGDLSSSRVYRDSSANRVPFLLRPVIKTFGINWIT